MNRGFILLADLSGFTTSVTETEVRHGTEVVAALLDAIIRRLSPPFLTAPLTGLLIAELAAGQRPSHPVEPFLLSRFDTRERSVAHRDGFAARGSGNAAR